MPAVLNCSREGRVEQPFRLGKICYRPSRRIRCASNAWMLNNFDVAVLAEEPLRKANFTES
jgi:hypothetical protein